VISEAGARLDGSNGDLIIEEAAKTLGELPESAPEFVRERAAKLALLIEMLNDSEWSLEGEDRARVVRLLAYFAETDDLIPDNIPTLGYLDDAIMVELVVRELRDELEAYDDFCRFRERRPELLKQGSEGATDREGWLGTRREQLQSRMRRRYRRRGGL
jgi:uncharacterized membrane protein YkvA (DUF1232 family)